MGNRLTLLLLLTAALFSALLVAYPHLGLIERGPIPSRPVPGLSAPETAVENASAERSLALADFTETVDRPLFAADRRPPAEVPVVAAPSVPEVAVPPSPPPALELSAVVIDGERRLALLRPDSGGGPAVRAEEGGEIEGWTVISVRPDGVTLERGGDSHEIALRTFKTAPAPARAPARRRPVKAGDGGREAQPAAVPRARPRRPLRGPRRRSIQRRQPNRQG